MSYYNRSLDWLALATVEPQQSTAVRMMERARVESDAMRALAFCQQSDDPGMQALAGVLLAQGAKAQIDAMNLVRSTKDKGSIAVKTIEAYNALAFDSSVRDRL